MPTVPPRNEDRPAQRRRAVLLSFGTALLILVVLFLVLRGDRDDESNLVQNSSEVPQRDGEPSAVSSIGEPVKTAPPRDETPLQKFARLSDDPGTWSDAATEFYQEWGAKDGPAAIAHAFEEGAAAATAHATQALEGWASSDLSAARDWVVSYREGREQGMLARGILNAMGDDADAKSELVRELAGGDYAGILAHEIATNLKEGSATAAADWVLALPETKSRTVAVERYFGGWAKSEPRAASQYLTAAPAGPARDAAVRVLVNTIAGEDPEAALIWAKTIADEGLRTRTVTALGLQEPE